MGITYTTYEAKARVSEVMRQVREGKTVTVSYRGEPVAEIRPLEKRKQTLEERIKELELRGVLVGPRKKRTPFKLGSTCQGLWNVSWLNVTDERRLRGLFRHRCHRI